ncbi:unnamed protein product [Ambrosiozyma monospora]|uniref:Unnamed protein product n=1 Tax=Ambrosiozyma monospora TaxID=43982 RepID=A0A9W7DK67_AMBMO|nr:unnamed protein product [Ambrosiozyma monospora]
MSKEQPVCFPNFVVHNKYSTAIDITQITNMTSNQEKAEQALPLYSEIDPSAKSDSNSVDLEANNTPTSQQEKVKKCHKKHIFFSLLLLFLISTSGGHVTCQYYSQSDDVVTGQEVMKTDRFDYGFGDNHGVDMGMGMHKGKGKGCHGHDDDEEKVDVDAAEMNNMMDEMMGPN